MPLNPVKSTHEGNWLHFIFQFGGTLHFMQVGQKLGQYLICQKKNMEN